MGPEIPLPSEKSNFQPLVNRPKKRVWRFFWWGLFALFIGVVGWVGISGALALKNITAKNSGDQSSFFLFNGEIPPDQLKGEGDGRINVLLLGIGGTGHPGGQLADTIQVLSVDPVNNSYALLSLPRDLYVTIPGNGRSKINAVYARGAVYCRGLSSCQDGVDQGGAAMKATVNSVLGVPIHYFIRIDFAGFEKVINRLGGIQVYVDKPLNDPFFPDERLVGFDPLYIPAGLQTFNGEKALKYARSRQSTSDFDRSRRQQQVLVALREKLLKSENLANPKKITDLLTILGNHLKTDLQVNELTKLFGLIKETDHSNTVTEVLDTATESPLRATNDPQAGYIIIPKKGINDFSQVQEFVRQVLKEPYLLKENAKIVIENRSGDEEIFVTIAAKLKSYGYNVIDTRSAEATQEKTEIEYFNNDKPYTVALLKKRLGSGAKKVKAPESEQADIIIVIGSKFSLE